MPKILSNIPDLGLTFIYPWRQEQQRVLERLDHYFDDKRFHLVAAPGAGKTVIGLEVFNRLKLRTLVLSPTTIVRDQWLERLTHFQQGIYHTPEWAGTTLDTQHYLTSTTYQALFSFDQQLNNIVEGDIESQFSSLVDWLKGHDIRLLILDEAHHLKAAWWKVLIKLANTDIFVVSLTATPPRDASSLEWSRYLQLCGEVDEEISIPELVRSNSLCPHQDYIWRVKTDPKNIASLERHDLRLEHLKESLATNQELLYLLSLHDWLDTNQVPSIRQVLAHLDECLALLGLMKQNNEPLPESLLSILEIKEESIQPITTFGWEQLLQGFIKGDHYPKAQPVAEFRSTFESMLRSKHFIKHHRVKLDNTQKKLDQFSKTQERISACLDIAKLEYDVRKHWMRLVVLADFIRDEKYQLALDGLEAPTGAYPIFHYFIHHLPHDLIAKTALFTGRLSIIHRDVLAELSTHLDSNVELTTKIYSECDDFVVLTMDSNKLANAMTLCHKYGDLVILVGTRGLLGEGWDAPHVNSLILATQTGAYVSTNQIRGRAIRIDPNDEFKVASIWHIIATAPNQALDQRVLHDLNKRFSTFAGIHAGELRIESGLDRLMIQEEEQRSLENTNTAMSLVQQSNHIMKQRLTNDLFNLQARWINALEKVEQHVFQTGLQVELSSVDRWVNKQGYVAQLKQKQKRKKWLKNTFLLLRPFLGVIIFYFIMENIFPEYNGNITIYLSLLVAAGAVIYYLSIGRVAKHAKCEKEASEIIAYPLKLAKVVLRALREIGVVKTKRKKDREEILITKIKRGVYRFSLNRFTHRENEVFLQSMYQLFEPIQQPRYIIALNNSPRSEDVYSVPHVFGVNKASAEKFIDSWRKIFPEFKALQLLSTRTDEGRKLLLQAKLQQYSAENNDMALSSMQLIEHWE